MRSLLPLTPPAGVLVVGESLVDVVQTAGREQRQPGGSPFNVAIGLARLGIPVRLRTQWGADPDGQLLAGCAAAAGVLVDCQQIPRTATAEAAPQPDGSVHYRLAVDFPPILTDLPDPTPWGVHVGSLAAMTGDGTESVAQLAERAARAGSFCSLDPNCRGPAGPPARFERLVRHCQLVKLSDEDAALLYPGQPPERVADRLLGLGAGLVVLTKGRAGAAAWTEQAAVTVPAPPVPTLVDPVGAGDAVTATLLARLHRSEPSSLTRLSAAALHDLLVTATTAAALTCARAGADLPTAAELAAALS